MVDLELIVELFALAFGFALTSVPLLAVWFSSRKVREMIWSFILSRPYSEDNKEEAPMYRDGETVLDSGGTSSSRFSRPFTTNFKAHKHSAVHNLRARHTGVAYCKHEPLDIVAIAIASFRAVPWSSSQQNALERWSRWIQAWQGPKDGVQPIRELLPIWSSIFFLGKLHEVDFAWEEGMLCGEGFCGETEWYYGRAGHTRVRLDPDNHSQAKGVEDHYSALLSTLLHECVHSFIHLYGCQKDCQSCAYAYGPAGHGRAWFHLASNVQAVARSRLQMDFRLSTYGSMTIPTVPEYVPTAEDWDELYKNFTLEDHASRVLKQGDRGYGSLIEHSLRQSPKCRKVLKKVAASFERDFKSISASFR